MLKEDDLWFLEEPIDEPPELFSIPEIRRHLVHGRADDEVGLRALLERPEALSKAWLRKTPPAKRYPKSPKRHHGVLHAA